MSEEYKFTKNLKFVMPTFKGGEMPIFGSAMNVSLSAVSIHHISQLVANRPEIKILVIDSGQSIKRLINELHPDCNALDKNSVRSGSDDSSL